MVTLRLRPSYPFEYSSVLPVTTKIVWHPLLLDSYTVMDPWIAHGTVPDPLKKYDIPSHIFNLALVCSKWLDENFRTLLQILLWKMRLCQTSLPVSNVELRITNSRASHAKEPPSFQKPASILPREHCSFFFYPMTEWGQCSQAWIAHRRSILSHWLFSSFFAIKLKNKIINLTPLCGSFFWLERYQNELVF